MFADFFFLRLKNMEQNNNKNFLENLITPKELAERGVLSLVTQWKERNRGRLKFYQIGRKILYDERHISDFLTLCESKVRSTR
jgi:hypothetical protein